MELYEQEVFGKYFYPKLIVNYCQARSSASSCNARYKFPFAFHFLQDVCLFPLLSLASLLSAKYIQVV